MDKLENDIFNILGNIYCYNCRFNDQNKTEIEWLDEIGYYGCDNCARKMMGWQPSENTIKKIIEVVNGSKTK